MTLSTTTVVQDAPAEAPLRHDFGRLLSPSAIAIVGASEEGQRIGGQALRFLADYGYRGRLFPVNPKRTRLRNFACYASVATLPESCDVALIAVAARLVPEVIEQCGEKRIPYAIVLSAGFRESGPEGARLEQELQAAVVRSGVRMVGPNCVGVLNVKERVFLGFGSGIEQANTMKVGPVAMVTQSGGYGFTMLSAAAEAGLGFSYMVSTGNSTDLDTLDFVEYFLECSDVDVVATFIEGVADGRRLIRIGKRALELGKPVLVWKAGNSQSGQRAAASHTASLAASYALYRAAFGAGGFIEIEDYDDLVDIARAFQARRLPAGNRVGIVASSGGAGVVLADRCDQYGMALPPLSESTITRLREILPSFASAANPVDISGQQVRKDAISVSNEALRIVLDDPAIDQVILRAQQSCNTPERAREYAEICKQSQKPVHLALGSSREPEARAIFDENRISWHLTPPRAALAAKALNDFAAKRRRHDTLAQRQEPRSVALHELPLLESGASMLSEHQSKACLSAYGIASVRETLLSPEDVQTLVAPPFAFPLVVKISSPDIPHKTEAGVVRVGVRSLHELKQAAQDVWKAAQHHDRDARIDGVLVQEMATGMELIAGAVNDACFGPTVMFGLGGIFTEALNDVTYRFAPFGVPEAREMVDEIRGSRLLKPYRGQPGLNVDGVAEVLSRLSWLITDHSDRIAEVDVNPLFVTTDTIFAADALIVLRTRPLAGQAETRLRTGVNV